MKMDLDVKFNTKVMIDGGEEQVVYDVFTFDIAVSIYMNFLFGWQKGTHLT
jgi:hypothetical protein